MTDTIEPAVEAIEPEDAEAKRRGRPPKAQEPELPKGYAKVRVLKKGDGKVATGERTLDGPTWYAKGDEFVVEEAIAIALEDAELVEIQK